MIVSALDSGLAVCAAFLDLRKAFDSLDHSILLERLHQLGVCDVELRWFCDYLSDHLQRLNVMTAILNGGVFWVAFRRAVR